MWLKMADARGPIFFNLDARLDIRTMTVADLVRTHGILHPEWAQEQFGRPDELLLMLMGPALTDFEIVISFPAGEHQGAKMEYVNQAIHQGLENGARVLNLDHLVQEAERHVQRAPATTPA